MDNLNFFHISLSILILCNEHINCRQHLFQGTTETQVLQSLNAQAKPQPSTEIIAIYMYQVCSFPYSLSCLVGLETSWDRNSLIFCLPTAPETQDIFLVLLLGATVVNIPMI